MTGKPNGTAKALVFLLDGRGKAVQVDCWVRAQRVEMPAFVREPGDEVGRVFGHVGHHRGLPVYMESQWGC